jgi:hypothetical protein
MGRYDAHMNPLSYRLQEWLDKHVTNHREQEAKSIPGHVQKMEKDFMHIAFETGNKIFTPPVMKMTQSFSRFGREPTQNKDMGMAVPGDYYLGGISAFGGGRTNFYPRGNLSSLSFQPVSNLDAPKRDYDQHWETGGPNGWRCKVQEKQTNSPPPGAFAGGNGGGSGGNGGSSAAAVTRSHRTVMQQRNAVQFADSGGSTSQSGSSQQQQQQQKDYTEFSFDKDGQGIVQSKDRKHYLKVNQKDKKIMLTGEGDSTFFGKNNAYLNSAGLCIVNPEGQSEESGAGWDDQQQGGSSQSGSGQGGLGGQSVLTGHVAGMPLSSGRALQQRMPKVVRTRTGVAIPTLPYRITKEGDLVINPLDGGGGGGGGGGGNKVYLGGDPQKHKFCLVETVCGPSKNVYARIG